MLLFGKLPSANRLVNPNLKELVSVPPSKEIELTAVLLAHTEFGLFYQLPKELLLVSISQLWVNRIPLVN
jgi:hypothetical protein